MGALKMRSFCITKPKTHKLNLVMKMKISWLKLKEDNNSFRIFKNIGLDVYDVEEPEDTDKKIQELVNREYRTIVISNELAGFSEDIIKKYKRAENINIIIANSKSE